MNGTVSCRGLVYIYRLEGYDVVALGGVDLDIAPGRVGGPAGPVRLRFQPPCTTP